MLTFRAGFTLLWLAMAAGADTVWQPVTDYSISFPGDRANAAPAINPFENFTHLGTDFGWMGPGEKRIDALAGVIRVKPDGEWTGTWHSLAGLASESGRLFDPADVVGLGGKPETLAGVRAVTLTARGNGHVRLELADVNRKVLWDSDIMLTPGEKARHRFELDAVSLGKMKFMNWIAEPGCSAEISSLGFEVERPPLPLDEWAFRVSLGKLRRCHDPESGMTRDRAHTPPGVFDTVPASGMHSLASAVAASEGILDREMVADEVRKTAAVLLNLPKAAGFLPHFTRKEASGELRIHPGTEYSTVDTAITLHSLRLAAGVLQMDDVRESVEGAIAGLDFDSTSDAEGRISHGFLDDGVSQIINRWREWGGETALVLALEAMVPGREPRGRMDGGGKVYQGVGFIGEIQSLFYPDFDRPEPDLLTGASWPVSRRDLLDRQEHYFQIQWPDSPAARAGIFGVSAGEAGMPAAGYAANGVDLDKVAWMHPHAMVMGLAQSGGGEKYRAGLQHLETVGFLYPQGLPENIEVDLARHNPMQSSLNAAFEALACYHGWRRANGGDDVIDRACRQDLLMRKAISRFYKMNPSP